MTVDLLIDNDVLIKCACYTVISSLRAPSGNPQSVGILGAARFVAGRQFQRDKRIRDPQRAQAAFEQFLTTVNILEPTEAELAVATDFEERASRLGVSLDSGESMLCAIALSRGWSMVLTGDKRAIRAMEEIQNVVAEARALQGRVICLEQAVAGIAHRYGADRVRVKICAEPDVDKAMSICFQCTGSSQLPGFQPVGLASYIENTRASAPTILYPGQSY
jgi:hypothetical protein